MKRKSREWKSPNNLAKGHIIVGYNAKTKTYVTRKATSRNPFTVRAERRAKRKQARKARQANR